MLKETVKALCRQKGITVQKLEKEVGLSNGTISKWNKAKPTVESLTKVAGYFGITVVDILKTASGGDVFKETELALEIERKQDDYEKNIMLSLYAEPQSKQTQELVELFGKLSDDDKKMMLDLAKRMAEKK